MAYTDSISDATPRKRQRLSNGRAYDSQDDSGDDFTSEDFNTVATLPLAAQKRKLGYSTDQFRADLNSTSSPPPHTTQPTQPLATTQQTQVYIPKTSSSPPRSNVQVERSSPPFPGATSPPPPPQSHQQQQPAPIRRAPFAKPSLLASAMAPPGTAFRRPPNVQPRPSVIDLDSDEDPPVQVSSDEEETQSALKPTKFKQGGRGGFASTTPPRVVDRIVKESPRPTAPSTTTTGGTSSAYLNFMSEFGYKPKPIDDSISAYGSVSRKPKPSPTAVSNRPRPAASSVTYKSLDDVRDYDLRRKVVDIQKLFPDESVQRCMDALLRKKGNVEDAMSWLMEHDEKSAPQDDLDELSTLSPVPKRGVAISTAYQQSQSSQPIRPSAKQDIKATMTIAEKYKAAQAAKRSSQFDRNVINIADEDEDDEDEDEIKPRRRLLQGRKAAGRSPTPPSSLPLQHPQGLQNRPKKQTVILSDDEAEEEANDSEETDEDEVNVEIQETEHEKKLLQFFNECSVRDVVDLCNQPEDIVQIVLDRRPFDSLDAIRAVTKGTETKSGKRSKARPIGEKIVEVCSEVRRGFEAVGELVDECERIAEPIQNALKGWGVGAGTSGDGELQLMNFDEPHDSGIGTPGSSCPPDEIPSDKGGVSNKKRKANFLAQPESMSSDITLKDYQLVGLNWLNLLWTKRISCILADDMGLGKTCQIIAFLAYLQQQKVDGVHLVIVPGSTLENWLREFARFAPSLEVRPYYGSQDERAELRESIEQEFDTIDVVVTTIDIAVRPDDNTFLRKRVDPLITVYDEAHALRNSQTHRYKQLLRIPATFRVLLTGTPLQNNLQELMAILAFIMPAMFDQKKEELQYIFKHKASTKDADHAALLSSQRIARARSMITPFILRRKKHQVLDLPTKHRRVEFCDMTPSQAGYYGELYEELQQAYAEKADVSIKSKGRGGVASAGTASKTGAPTLMTMREVAIHPLLRLHLYDDKKLDRIATELLKREWAENPRERVLAYLKGEHPQSFKGGDFGVHKFCEERAEYLSKFTLKKKEWMDAGKVSKFADLVTNFAANGDRVLVFSQFTTLMDILEAVLNTLNIRFVRLDGSTDMNSRQDLIDAFHQDATIPVFLLSTRAGGAGINLACANKVIIFDSGFNPQDDIQAENRAHRVGQTREVEVVRLVSRHTIEEQIHALGESKLALDERVSGDDGNSEAAGQKMVEEMFLRGLQEDGKKGDALKAEKVTEAEEQKEEKKGDVASQEAKTSDEQEKEEKVNKKEKIPAKKIVDIRDAFKTGLEDAGVKVKSKQARF